MTLTFRIDLDYVPWDTPDADEFGHGEPAQLLRLLELARQLDLNFHFFASDRVLRAFPSSVEAVLTDGHDLDWLCKHPESFTERYEAAVREFTLLGHQSVGLAVRHQWPENLVNLVLPTELAFLSCVAGPSPDRVRVFAFETLLDRDAARNGMSTRSWSEGVKTALRTAASLNRGSSICVRPQVLAKFDPKLHVIRDLLQFGRGLGFEIGTYREQL